MSASSTPQELPFDQLPSALIRGSRSRISTGIEGFDDILFGGLPSGFLYLVEGDPGTGTTFSIQMPSAA
jgi:circadian clock protein KaiC